MTARARAQPDPRPGHDGRLPARLKSLAASHLSQWRWRLTALALAALYLAQDAAGLRWQWLDQIQTNDLYKYATGCLLLAYVGWQWYLFIARQRRMRIQAWLIWHQRSGVLAPVLFYIHSVHIGYGYLAALSWVFFANILLGAASPVGVRLRSRAYTALWTIAHILFAALTLLLALFHAYIAFYYK